MCEEPLVSIIIINFNGIKFLANLFDSLEAQNFSDYEVIIIDNNSQDGSKEYLENSNFAFKCNRVYSNSNLGFAKANNLGLKYCRGKLICLLNYDTTVHENWLTNLVNGLQKHSADAVGPKILFKDTFQLAVLKSEKNIRLENPPSALNTKFVTQSGKLEITKKMTNYFYISSENKFLPKLKKIGYILLGEKKEFINSLGLLINYQTGKAVDYGIFQSSQLHQKDFVVHGFTGCCFLIRKSIIEEFGFFRDELFMYYEDVDLFWRLKKNNISNFYTIPSSIVYHIQSPSLENDHRLKKFFIDRNRLLVFFYNGNLFRWLIEYFIYILYSMKNLLMLDIETFRITTKVLLSLTSKLLINDSEKY